MAEFYFSPELERQSFSHWTARLVWERRFAPRPMLLTCDFFDFAVRRPGWAEHFHHPAPPLNRLFAVTRGTITVECRGRRYPVRSGEAILLSALMPFRTEYPADAEMFFLHFSLTDRIRYWLFSRRETPLIVPIPAPFPRPAVLPEVTAFLTPTPAEELQLLQSVVALIDPEEWETVRRHCRLSESLARLFELLEERPPAAVRVKELADALGMSTATLTRRFRSEFPVPLTEFLLDRTAQAALRRLSKDQAPLTRVARELGFRDPGYFHRFFRRRFGCTPSEWRAAGVEPAVES